MPSNLSTRLKNLATGTSLAASLFSAAAVGSILTGGNFYFDPNQNTTPDIYYSTGAFLTYTEHVCAGTGSRQTYDHCRIENPYSGTGMVNMIQYQPEGPMPGKITCHTALAGSTATGVKIPGFLYRVTASGVTIGYQSGTLSVPGGWGVRCWGTTNPGATRIAKLKIWWNQFYVP